MKKYKTEGDIDFFSELYKSLDEDASDNVIVNDENICLISKLPLIDRFVELNCGHKFNYIPLYKDVVNHKLKFNGMEAQRSHLKKTQIRCPYCRQKQEGLLPFYDDMPEIKKIDSVNYINNTNEPDTKSKLKFGICLYVYKNPNFNIELPESAMNPLTIKCQADTHLYKIADVAAGDYKYYCYHHKNALMKENTLKIKEKAKQEKKEAAEKAKQEKKEAAEKAKQEKKEAAEKAKQEKKEAEQKAKQAKKEELSVNEQVNVTNGETKYCSQIIKFGSNKGKACGVKISCDDLCKRHYKMKLIPV